MLEHLSRDKKKLHWVAANKNSDWDGVKDRKLNTWQHIAKGTYGFVTPANIISICGLYLVINGIRNYGEGSVLSGVLQVGLGRLLDYFDGIVANKTSTKSFIGATMDVSVDTLEFLLVIFVLASLGTIPWVLVTIILVPKFCGAIGYSTAKMRGKAINTTGQAKIAAALTSFGLLFFMSSSIDSNFMSQILSTGGWGLLLFATFLSFSSVILYIKVGFTAFQQKKS